MAPKKPANAAPAKPRRPTKTTSASAPKQASSTEGGTWIKQYNAQGKAKMVWRPDTKPTEPN